VRQSPTWVLGQLSDAVRRIFAFSLAATALVVLSPVLAAVALGIRITMGSGVLFRQERLGLAGRPFMLVKFRTMHRPETGSEGPEFDRERLSLFGQFVRSMSLDELPSLWNLARGDITLVGPRPLPTEYWSRFRGDEYRRFEVKPGITGLAQVSGRNLVDWPERLALDVQYVRERSLRSDIGIIARTLPVVLKRSGISADGMATMHALPADRP
jgi:lipopolysaccharide/colanic/teichoic acid biosynthesis glycosyltransferase